MNQKLLMALIASGGTTVQKLMAANMDVSCLRTNASLQNDEWKAMDSTVIQDAQDRLVGVADIRGRGLVYAVANGMGKTILESENISDMNDADVTMDGQTRTDDDTVNYELVGLPLPIYAKRFSLNARKLAASRNSGEALDTTQAGLSGRKVADLEENTLFNGYNSFKFGGYYIYGYTDYPSRNTYTIAVTWTSATGAQIITDVIAMKALALAEKRFGPFVMYIPSNYETVMDKDYKASGQSLMTIRDRILRVGGIEGIKVSDKLSANNVVLVQMTADNVRIVDGLPLTTVEWSSQGQMVFHFQVMTIAVPQMRTDQSGNSGIVHGSV